MLFHPELEPWRCVSCGRLLARIRPVPGFEAEQRCPRCHASNYTRMTESARETGIVALLATANSTSLRS